MRTRDNRWLALAVVCLGQLMMILDATIVAVALPAIKTDLHFSASSLTWVPNAYLIAFGSFLLLGGRLADLVGRTRMFLAGIAIFTAASLLCGFAGSEAALIAARFVQGVGAALCASAVLALIVVEFPSPAERIRAMSAYTFVSVAGASIGLITGGLLTQALDWHWIFFINLPIGIATFALGYVALARDRGLGIGPRSRRPGLGADHGRRDGRDLRDRRRRGARVRWALRLGAVAVALLAAFVAVERQAASPILPLNVMRLRSLMVSSSVRALMVCGMWASFFVGALYLQRVLGMGPIAAGAAFLPQTLTVAALSLGPTARLTARFGERRILITGLTVLVAGLAVFALALQPGAAYFPGPALAFTLIGVGAGLSFMTLMTLALADVPAADAGIASGVINVSTQISAAIGLAVLGTIAASRTNALGAQRRVGDRRAVRRLPAGVHRGRGVRGGGAGRGGCVAAGAGPEAVEAEAEVELELAA